MTPKCKYTTWLVGQGPTVLAPRGSAEVLQGGREIVG